MEDSNGKAYSLLLRDLSEIVKSCTFYYEARSEALNAYNVSSRRASLSMCVQKFHQESGTWTQEVESACKRLSQERCMVLMTAHQPNLFAYGGVIRKATLSHVLSAKLASSLNLPVVSIFGFADQDFTDDRWVRSAVLPDVTRRNGELELYVKLPEKTMLNMVPRLEKTALSDLENQVRAWLHTKVDAVRRLSSLQIISPEIANTLESRLDDFWQLVNKAYNHARNYSDFNAFTLSRIANEIWGYDTLFFRFSDFTQYLEPEICLLLSQFSKYSEGLKQAANTISAEDGVFENEYVTIPFWYHCKCGSKARLTAEKNEGHLIGRGSCVKCEKTYMWDFGPEEKPNLSGIEGEISLRSLPMPLIFFEGLGISGYTGGAGGKDYLKQAIHVSEHLGQPLPPIMVWRPHDVYYGVAQIEALLTFKASFETFNLNAHSNALSKLKKKIEDVEENIQEIEERKQVIVKSKKVLDKNDIEEMKKLSKMQSESRRLARLPEMYRQLKILENIKHVAELHPCVIDYVVNIGLKNTSEQWIEFLDTVGVLDADVNLKTPYNGLSLSSCANGTQAGLI